LEPLPQQKLYEKSDETRLFFLFFFFLFFIAIPFFFSLLNVDLHFPGVRIRYETYHGVFVNVMYQITVDITRPMLAKNLKKTLEFIVEIPTEKNFKPTPVPFTVTPESLENVKKSSLVEVPQFRITGRLDSAVCPINAPFTGELTVNECSSPIKSIEVQLVRVETTGSSEGFAKEATEIQNVQLADGDVCRNLTLPIYMIFPRLFVCPTASTRTWKTEFEVNIVILFQDGYLVTENHPIKVIRLAQEPATATVQKKA
jgi:hypothetical protein